MGDEGHGHGNGHTHGSQSSPAAICEDSIMSAQSHDSLAAEAGDLLPAMLWACVASSTFGLMLFILDYTVNRFPRPGAPAFSRCDLFTNCGLIWVSCGLVGVFKYVQLRMTGGVIWEDAADDNVADDVETIENSAGGSSENLLLSSAGGCSKSTASPEPPFFIGFIGLVGGLGIGLGHLFMMKAFAFEPDAAGPLCSIASGEVFIVFAFFHGFTDRLNGPQWVACFGLFAGLALIAQHPNGEGNDGSPLGPGGLRVKTDALISAFAAMVCISVSVISIRFGVYHNASATGQHVIRMAVLLVMGLIALLAALIDGGFWASLWPPVYGTNLLLTALPLACGGLQALASLAVNFSLNGRATIISMSIFSGNSFVVLLLNYVVNNLHPTLTEVQGMTLVVASCALLALGSETDWGEQEVSVCRLAGADTFTTQADEGMLKALRRPSSHMSSMSLHSGLNPAAMTKSKTIS